MRPAGIIIRPLPITVKASPRIVPVNVTMPNLSIFITYKIKGMPQIIGQMRPKNGIKNGIYPIINVTKNITK